MFHDLIGRRLLALAVFSSIVLLAVAAIAQAPPPAKKRTSSAGVRPTVANARAFVDAAEKRLLDLWIASARASWVQQNFITDDTERMAADADQR